MALIQCPNCEKTVSDRAVLCPHCGEFIQDTFGTENNSPEEILCEECGSVLPPDALSCPHCGCPVSRDDAAPSPQKVEVTSVNLKVKKSTKKYIILSIIAVVLIALIVLIGKSISEQRALQKAAEESATYQSGMEAVSFTMLIGAMSAEDAGNLIKAVWSNSIYEERDTKTDKYTRPNGYFYDDFNDALATLFSDSEFQETLSSIESNQDSVAAQMKTLKNPPEEHEEAYEALKDLYDAYLELTNLATNPSGNLQTYASNFNDADSETVRCYDALSLYLD